MRRIVAHMQTTLDGRIANERGEFWEPFPWGEQEQAWVNGQFAAADVLALSRVLYEAIVPWWDAVAAGDLPDDAPPASPAYEDFARIQAGMHKVVFSRTMPDAPGRTVIAGDLAPRLERLKREDGRGIMLAAGPATLGPLAQTPGLIDEYLVVVHPAVLSAGPRMFDGVTGDLALRLVEATPFPGGCVALRYAAG